MTQTCKGFLKKTLCATILFVKILEKIIFWLFAILLFLVPLILWPFTSEVFEFNKMVLVYIFTILITSAWVIDMILEKKFIFRRTILDIPLLVFLGTQLVSTLLSIDPSTSWFGYYSRFNGGMFSVISYSLLYFVFVTYFNAKTTIKLINTTLISAAIVSVYGVMEHYGIDKKIWVQDVQSRVFSTLGQPNWLAAWIIALMPITWVFMLNAKLILKSKIYWTYFSLSALFFWTLIFTKSRSGFVGFGVMFLVFWIIYFWIKRQNFKQYLIPFSVIGSSLIIICLISGTQWTPSLASLLKKQATGNIQQPAVVPSGTALENPGTESGKIRSIVWNGAVRVWLHYPIFGSGVETFAYSYYLFRQSEHNLTSEWNFIYNKAHNEYLNFAASSGTVGLISYLILIIFSCYAIVKKSKNQKIQESKQIENNNYKFAHKAMHSNSDLFGDFEFLRFGIFAGYVSILVTNFFGFSVVPTQIEFFLFPAIAFAITKNEEEKAKNERIFVSNNQKVATGVLLLFAFYLIILIFRYWNADRLYASGVGYNSINKTDIATNYLTKAIDLEPGQALYYGSEKGLAYSYTSLALAFNQQKQPEQAAKFADLAISEINKAVNLSPANVNYKRVKFGIFVMLSAINPNYLINARDTLETAIPQAPTDAKLYYNLGLVYARTGQPDLALDTLKKTINLKSDYKEARLAYAYLLIDKMQNAEAKIQLEYILTNIDPNDSLSKQALESIK